MEGLTSELLKCVGERMIDLLHTIIKHNWNDNSSPSEWIDAILITLFKSGLRDGCGNYRGISILSVVGKVLTTGSF